MGKEIISEDLLKVLACPVCKTDVELIDYKNGEHGLRCINCKRIYPIKDGIPVMLVEEALIECDK
jgi:uncharacterized protein YbaR (Trm112 family)